MGHDHGHHHHHLPARLGRSFALGVGLNLLFVAVEFTYGFMAGSLALIADAGHNLSDVLGLLLAWGAAWLSGRQPSARRTYGLRRTTILAALANAMLLLVAVGGILWEAIERLGNPGQPGGLTVMVVAGIGILINAGTALLFMRDQHHDLNVRGAYLHMAADAAVSLGVVIAAGAMLVTGWLWLDAAISIVIALVILVSTWGLLRDSVNLAIDGVPAGIAPEAIRAYLAAHPAIASAHDLHIWGLSTTEAALTVHLVLKEPYANGPHDALLAEIAKTLHDEHQIEHATMQIESRSHGGCGWGCGEMRGAVAH